MARIEFRVTPRARQNALGGFDSEGRCSVRLVAPPVEGKANAALIAFLADVLGVAPRRITIVRGESGRLKLVEVEGMTDLEARSLLENMTS